MTTSNDTLSISADLAVVLWRALHRENRQEADILAAAMIQNDVFINNPTTEEAYFFWKEYLVVHGVFQEDIDVKLN
jgi:hypothetical protein|tara:strand:- start:440 stop:667 length:228 start_codon:yes stop_codon:yes gene_type:complete